MKRLDLLLLVLVLSAFNRAFGQGLTISPSDTFTFSGTLAGIGDSHEQNGTFTNNTADTVNINWRAVSVIEDSTWQMSFCDPLNCYYYSLGENLGNYGLNSFPAAPHTSYQLRFGVAPYCIADSGKMVVVAWLANDSAGSSQTIRYFTSYSGSCATAIQTVSAPGLRIYPSPVISNLSVEGLAGYTNVKLTVYDILGNTVIQKNVAQPGNIISVNTDMLYAGVYIVSVESEGTKLLTRRIQKLD